MKKYKRNIGIALQFILVFQLNGQISHGGKPLMNDEDFKASKVLYLLEPEDQLLINGLKSSINNTCKKALEYAIERPVDISPEYNGEWIEKNGLQVWRAHIISPDAFSMGVLFSDFHLNDNVRLFIYSPDGRYVKGSFTSENNKKGGVFYVGHIPGEEVVIEMQIEKPQRDYGSFRIASVSHAFLPVYSEKSIYTTGLGTAQDCELDVNCSEGEDWQVIKRSVCHISTGTLLCTGVLINNTSYDGTPYVLTAEHCINKEFRAESSVFYFGYENSTCGVNDAKKDKSVSGSTLISTGDSLDFTLVKLSSKPPREYNVYYSGWDSRAQNYNIAVTLHHPNADAMKISFENNGTEDASFLTGDLNDYLLSSNYHIREWDIGSTEGGSSGCPLFNSSKRLIGVLSGGLASCGDSIGYDNVYSRTIYSTLGNKDDFFSKFYFDWDYYEEAGKQLKKWLDPSGSGQYSIGGLSAISIDVEANNSSPNLIRLYPNPSNGNFVIDLPNYDGREMKLYMYDLTGQLVFVQNLQSVYPVDVSIPSINPGMYFIRIRSEKLNMAGRIILE